MRLEAEGIMRLEQISLPNGGHYAPHNKKNKSTDKAHKIKSTRKLGINQ